MDILLVICRLLLASLFTIAGTAKLLDLAGSQRTMHEFGIPLSLAKIVGLLLPLIELVLAVFLIPAITAWWAALGILTLLFIFIGGISFNLAQGRKPDCHCFGALSSTPIGWRTIVRNGILAALAGLIVWQGPDHVGPSAVSWLSDLTLPQIIELIAIVIILGLLAGEGWFLFNLLRQNGRLLLRIEALEKKLNSEKNPFALSQTTPTIGLPFGAPAPAFQLPDPYGEMFTLDALRATRKPLVLIFSDPGCGPCNVLMPEIAHWQHEYTSELIVALISRGTVEVNRAKSREHGLTHVLLQQDYEIADAYRINGTPSAVIVRSDGTIGSAPFAGVDAIRELIMQTLGRPTTIQPTFAFPAMTGDCDCGNGNGHALIPTRPMHIKIGEPVPPLKLSDLSGQIVDLVDIQNETLVLFWNPGCGFCIAMLNDLKAWEASPPEGAPQLLIVSTGTIEENRRMELRSSIVLDPSFSAGYAFGVNGTPSAVLVDAEGKIASEIAVGASAILVLASSAGTIGANERS